MEKKRRIGFEFINKNDRNHRITLLIPLICSLLLLYSPLLVSSSVDSSPQTNLQGTGVPGSSVQTQEGPHVHEVHCSRERSRAAWSVIQEYLMPYVEREKYQLSSQCKLHPNNDLFRDQEEHKIHVDIHEWRCGYCKKSFRAENNLDQHFDNRHSNLLKSNGKCLADLCGALHCDLMMDTKSRKSKCNPAAAAKNRHLCESLADSCFPVNHSPSASRLHDLFLRQFCDAHTCSRGSKPFAKGGRKNTSVFYLAISILTLMLLPIFYTLVYLYQSQMRRGTQELKRISKLGHQKSKPS
ncbi:OLC1v1013526C2 [Oldenlandia corymbosa var. corymbosa]|uniref:OLC1v1013526C2 n=1 Tax=Oldenlandia corymbosa var. corymbosa TaxID=529605 RepID=A0AAV1DYU9_OLDCO|nr:OLC1v1013526C2 [Oldenlandia corymbosa var. corymbosa]